AMLPASSFAVGELVPISLDIRNNSSRPIKRLELTLVERSTFVGSKASTLLCNDKNCCGCYRSGHTKTEAHEKVLVRLVEELAVEPYTSTSLLRTLTLPESVMPFFDNCPIVQNRHFIKLSLVPDTWIGSNTTTDVPIKIRFQAVKRLLLPAQQSAQKEVREPTAPRGTEGFPTEKSLYPNDLLG
ncbi:CBN-ARRD-7 protein, partial [Aphelenchoides avenae]